jgi:TM2 domain-containing membrane protein YozV
MAGMTSPSPDSTSDKLRLPALLFAVISVFSVLGIHLFYVGRVNAALVRIILSITVYGLVITIPWGWIDAI